jgi:hypothetical protein
MTASFSFVLGVKPELQERVFVLIGDESYVTPAPAIAAARPATGNIFFAPEGKAAIAAVTGLNKNADLIDKHMNKKKPPVGNNRRLES